MSSDIDITDGTLPDLTSCKPVGFVVFGTNGFCPCYYIL